GTSRRIVGAASEGEPPGARPRRRSLRRARSRFPSRHFPICREAMKSTRAPTDLKWGARSSWSSIMTPQRSSIPIASSMKSSESSPSEPSIPLGSDVCMVMSAARAGSNFSRSTRRVLIASRIFSLSMSRLFTSPGDGVPDVEEVEPLRRVPADGVLEKRDPGAEGLLLAPGGDGQRLRDGHRVAPVGVEHAEGGNKWDPQRAGKDERSQRKRRRRPKERDQGLPAGSQRAVSLHRDDLAPPERGDQLERDGRRGAGNEAHAIAVPAHPSLERSHFLLGHHDA